MMIVMGFAAAWPAIARAQPPADPDDRARLLFESGRDAYELGRYDDAYEYFARAYDLSGHPELLFNMGSALDRARRDREAIQAYETYLRTTPDPENRVRVEQRLDVLMRGDEDDGSVLSEWWFWAIAGAVVVGTGVLVIALAASADSEVEPPIPGDLGPGGVVAALRWP
jgi:tetratricopeptide (TPR) repeat protein